MKMSCILCFAAISKEKSWDYNLVRGKRGFDVLEVLRRLEVGVQATSEHICQACLRLLRKIDGAQKKVQELEGQAISKYRAGALKIGVAVKTKSSKRALFAQDVNTVVEKGPRPGSCPVDSSIAIVETPAKTIRLVEESRQLSADLQLTSTPKSGNAFASNIASLPPPPTPASSEEIRAHKTQSFLRIVWPSQTKERRLPADLNSVGSMLLRGTYKQIAGAVWRHAKLRASLVELFIKEIDKECNKLCVSKKEDKPCASKRAHKIATKSPGKSKQASSTDSSPSCLRLTKKEDILKFKLENLDEELKERAPLVRSTLMAMSWRRSKKTDDDMFFAPSVCMAAAVCLKNRSRRMTAMQLILSLMLQHSGFMATLLRMSTLRLAVSHTFLYKKMDEFGHDHLKEVYDSIRKEGLELSLASSTAPLNSSGRKLVIDNFNYTSQPHEMTEDRQNKVVNWVGLMIAENRISGSYLDCNKPSLEKLMGMENGLCLPNNVEHAHQRRDYIALCGRIAVKHITCLQNFNECVVKHIKHQYSDVTCKPTNTIFAEMIYEDENQASGMQNVMTHLHNYVPSFADSDSTIFGKQGVVGDQLTIERGVNCLLQLENGFTSKERLEGLHLEVADFHAGMKFLQLALDNFYNPKATTDKCTLFSDKVLINRRNVNTDVSRNVDGCKKFFILEIHARIIAGFCVVLGIDSPDQILSNDEFKSLAHASNEEKKEFLNRISAEVVDKFVVRADVRESMVKSKSYEDWLLSTNKKNKENLFMCRYDKCPRTFKFDGKRRMDHEKTHGLHNEIDAIPPSGITDDMFNYQCSLLDIGMVILNFFDAVSEGDGQRVIRCWKFMLPYLKHDGARSRKYALEALFIFCQIYAILSPKEAHRLIWNRFQKNKEGYGGNIPLDLALEHYNNLLKTVVKNLGPNATNPRVIDRYCKALTVNKKLLQNFDSSCGVLRRSGKHVEANVTNDLMKVVSELMKNGALLVKPGRHYQLFSNMDASILQKFSVHEMYQWIDEHKKYIRLHKSGR